MLKVVKFNGFGLILGIVLILPVIGLGQDLGSSNGLHRSPNPASKSTSSKSATPAPKRAISTPKKSSAKPKAETSKAKPTVRKVTPKATAKKSEKSSKPAVSQSASIPKREVYKPTKPTISSPKTAVVRQTQDNIVINVGQKTNGDYNEIFEQAIDEGNGARDDRNYVGAENAYRRAKSLKPRDSRAIYGLGNLFSDQQRWEEAEAAYRQAIQLESSSPEAYIALSFVLTQPVPGASVVDRYAEAEKMARRAIELDGSNAVAFDQLGVALEFEGFIEQETKNAYTRAIQLDPKFALAYAHLGRLLRRNGLTNESTAAYRDAIRLSSDVPTMILVADVMQSQQRFMESEQLLKSALRADPKNPTALYFLGRALTTRGSYDEAEKVLRTSLEVSPSSFVAYALLSSLYVRRNKIPEAEGILMKALNVISPSERRRLSKEFELVGDGFMKMGQGAAAARVYRQAIALDGDKIVLAGKLNRAQKS